MAVQPATDGYLSRATNLPSNATGWALCFWFRRTGSVAAGVAETLFEIVDVGDGDYIKLYVWGDDQNLYFQGINDFENVSLFTTTLNQWYFVCLKTTSSTAGSVLWRADSDATMSSSTGRKFQTDNGWDSMILANAANFLEDAEHFEFFCLKTFIGTLSDAQVWEQSIRMLPKAQGATLDSYLPLYVLSAVDEGGLGRNWVATGGFAEPKTQPRIPRGAGSSALLLPQGAALSQIAATLTGVGTLTGTLRGAGALAGSLPAVGSLAGTLRGAGALAAALGATGTLTGTLSGGQSLISAALSAAGALTGTLRGAGALAGSLAGVGTLAGTLHDASAPPAAPSGRKLRDRQRGREMRRRF